MTFIVYLRFAFCRAIRPGCNKASFSLRSRSCSAFLDWTYKAVLMAATSSTNIAIYVTTVASSFVAFADIGGSL